MYVLLHLQVTALANYFCLPYPVTIANVRLDSGHSKDRLSKVSCGFHYVCRKCKDVHLKLV